MNVEGATPLRNADYFFYVLEAIATARSRIWASVFSMNVNFLEDEDMRVRTFADALREALERGVDVRVLMGGERVEPNAFRVANAVSCRYLASLGVDVRHYAALKKSSAHAKYVVVDEDLIVMGSHNWSPRSFTVGIDDSIALRSTEVNAKLAEVFLGQWSRSDSNE